MSETSRKKPGTRRNGNNESAAASPKVGLSNVTPGLINEVRRLLAAVHAGILKERAQVSGFEDGEREILSDINEMLDTITAPLSYSAQYVESISRGDILLRSKITTAVNSTISRTV